MGAAWSWCLGVGLEPRSDVSQSVVWSRWWGNRVGLLVRRQGFMPPIWGNSVGLKFVFVFWNANHLSLTCKLLGFVSGVYWDIVVVRRGLARNVSFQPRTSIGISRLRLKRISDGQSHIMNKKMQTALIATTSSSEDRGFFSSCVISQLDVANGKLQKWQCSHPRSNHGRW